MCGLFLGLTLHAREREAHLIAFELLFPDAKGELALERSIEVSIGPPYNVSQVPEDTVGMQRILWREWELVDLRVRRTYYVGPSERQQVSIPAWLPESESMRTLQSIIPTGYEWNQTGWEMTFDQLMDVDRTPPGTPFISVFAKGARDGYPTLDMFVNSDWPLGSNWNAMWNAETRQIVELHVFAWPDCESNISAPKTTLADARKIAEREYMLETSQPLPLQTKMQTGWMLYLGPARRRLVHQFRYNDGDGYPQWMRYVDAETGELIRHPHWNPAEGT
jgi:hypothetical protein